VFIGEIESIMEAFGSYSIDVIVCDDRVRSIHHCENGDKIEYDLLGGGGTDFTPVFELVETFAFQPKILLYFTDLEGKFPLYEPSYEVVWVASKSVSVPFGRVIVLKDQDD
jgi:predicted metal-dependent peptidase